MEPTLFVASSGETDSLIIITAAPLVGGAVGIAFAEAGGKTTVAQLSADSAIKLGGIIAQCGWAAKADAKEPTDDTPVPAEDAVKERA